MKFKRITGLILILLFTFSLWSCQKAVSASGYVVDSTSKFPLNNVLIEAFLNHPSPDAFVMRTRTNQEGAYYVYTQPFPCTGTCPELVVQISLDGYQPQTIKNPHNDTTYLVKIN